MIPALFFSSNDLKSYAEELAQKLGASITTDQDILSKPHLELAESGLSFFHPDARSTNKFRIDFESGSMGWRLKRANHEKLIKKALGKSDHPLKILDCTAGMLQDSMLFLSLGHEVTAVEQSKILFALLEDGIKRNNKQSLFKNLHLERADACSFAREANAYDVIYFDPMYPPTKKSALSSGQLEYIAKILEIESIINNSQEDFEVLQLMPVKKLIVKRPIKANAFADGINYQVSGKTTRFDVYI